MNAYRFSYEGLWLGGTMIVIAPNKEIAEQLAIEELKEKSARRFLKEDLKTLELEEEISIVQASVIFKMRYTIDNGDY